MSTKRTHDGWELREAGPEGAAKSVLFLPGGLCSAEFYEDLLAEPKLSQARLVAATVPGFGRTTPPADLSMENFARLGGKLASDLGSDVVVGHSYGANIALEMAAGGTFKGPIVLLSPTFSAPDEMKPLGALDKIGRVPLLGPGLWGLAIKMIPSGMKKELPSARAEVLATDMGNNDPGFCRRSVRKYFQYMKQYGEVATRLCSSGVKAWVVRGDKDQVGLTDGEKATLDACPTVTMVTIPDGTHMAFLENRSATADVILDAVAAA